MASDQTIDELTSACTELSESVRVLTLAVDKLNERVESSIVRFDETASALADEIDSLASEVVQNTQNLRVNGVGG